MNSRRAVALDAPANPVMNWPDRRAFPQGAVRKARNIAMGWEDDWKKGDRLGDYELVELLGEGGMSRVYEGRHVTLGRRVAIKTLRGEHRQNADLRRRFDGESKKIALVEHRHIVEVITVGTHRESPYFVMKFLSGKDLEKHLRARGKMDVEETLALLLPVFSAVKEMHYQGIIHRDLKPANIVLEKERNGRLHPMVVDFGIARLADGHVDHLKTHGTALLGTPAYMASEQLKGKVSERTDQYALAVILYECLAGRSAFADGPQGAPENNLFFLLKRVEQGDCPPLQALRPDLPEGLTQAIARAMSFDANERFASVGDFALALLPFADAVTRANWAQWFVDDGARKPEPPPPTPPRVEGGPPIKEDDTVVASTRRIPPPPERPVASAPQWKVPRRTVAAVVAVFAGVLAVVAVWWPPPTPVSGGSLLNVADASVAPHDAERTGASVVATDSSMEARLGDAPMVETNTAVVIASSPDAGRPSRRPPPVRPRVTPPSGGIVDAGVVPPTPPPPPVDAGPPPPPPPPSVPSSCPPGQVRAPSGGCCTPGQRGACLL